MTRSDIELSTRLAERDLPKRVERRFIIPRKRFSLDELMAGAEYFVELNDQTEWAREGGSVGREVG
jgi:hypothetical protein